MKMCEIKGKKHLIVLMSIVCCLFLLIAGMQSGHTQEVYSEDFTGDTITNTSMFEISGATKPTPKSPEYLYYENGICYMGGKNDKTDTVSIGGLTTKSKFGPVSVTADVAATHSSGTGGGTTNRNALFIGMRVPGKNVIYSTGNQGIWFSFNPQGNMYVGNRNGGTTLNLETSVTNPLNYSALRKVTVIDSGAEIFVFGYNDAGEAVQLVRVAVNADSVDVYAGTSTTKKATLTLTLPSEGYILFQANCAKCAVDNITIEKHIAEDFTGNKIDQILGSGAQVSSPVTPTTTPIPTPTSTAPAASGAALLFDMGTPTSPVEEGYQKIEPKTAYQEGQFGWVSASSLDSRDRDKSKGTALTRDFVLSSQSATFKATAENGRYKIEVLLGDMTNFHDQMAVKVNGQLLASNITTNVGEIKTVPMIVDVTNGTLELEFYDDGGSDENWVVCAVRIIKGDEASLGPVTEPITEQAVAEPEISNEPGSFDIVTKNLRVDCTYVTIKGISENIREKMWFEVYSEAKNNQMVDFGAFAPDSEWFFTARHMNEGNNKIVVFAKQPNGVVTSKFINVKLELGDEPVVRPRPIPAEIWWGGVSDPEGLKELLTSDSEWDYVKNYLDMYFLHASLWFGNNELAQNLTQYLKPYGMKYGIEIGGGIEAKRDNDPNADVSKAQISAWGNFLNNLITNGFVFSEITHDYRPEVFMLARDFPEKSEQELIDLFADDWNKIFKAYSEKYPYSKIGHTQCPLYWPWGGYQALLGRDKLMLHPVLDKNNQPLLVNGSTIDKTFNMADIMAKMMQTLNSIGMPYDFYTDCPNAFLSGKTYVKYAPLIREKIRAYEKWFQSNGSRHIQICNAQVPATVTDDDEWHRQYLTNAFDSLTTVQKDGGRSNAYLFESWSRNAAGEWMPKKIDHEDEEYTFTNLAKRGLKYLKGIKDVNGNLEKLSFTITPEGNGMTVGLKNDGDVMCLPAIVAYQQAGDVNTIKWTDVDGNDITDLIYSPEGWTESKALEPGEATIITCTKTDASQDAKIMLEAFWNPQDPTGIVRDRKIVVLSGTKVEELPLTTPLKTNYNNVNINEDVDSGNEGEIVINNTASINVLVDNVPVNFDVEPAIVNDRVMVPFRAIFERLGAGVDWNEAYQQVAGTKGETKINLTIGNPVAMIGNTGRMLDSVPIIVDGRTLIPVRFISESLGFKVSWDEASRTVAIDSTPTDISVPDNQPVYQFPGHPAKVKIEDRKSPNAQEMKGKEIPILAVDGVVDQPENPLTNSFDGNLETRWSGFCNPYSADATYDLGAVKKVSGLSVSFYSGNERAYYFDIQTSLDGVTWNDEYYAKSTSGIKGFEGYEFAPRDARYVRISGYGSTTATTAEWFGVEELKIYGE